MRVKNKIEKPFGPTGTSTGVVMFIIGIIYIYFSLIGIILVFIGAFIGFTSVNTFLDIEKRKIKFSNSIFGIIPTGKWIDITNDMKIGLENKHRGYRTYSRGMRTLDLHIKDIRIVLYGPDNKKIGPINKFKSLESAKKNVEELRELLGLEIHKF